MTSLFTRSVARELCVPLAAWLGSLWLLLFTQQAMKGSEIILGSAVTWSEIGRLLFYLTPHFLVMALPIAFLLAVMLGLGRLAEDRELVAMQALGHSPYRVLGICVGLGGLAAGFMVLLACTAQPWGLSSLESMVGDLIKKNVIGDVKPGVFYQDLSELTLYAEKVDPARRQWTNILIQDDRDPAQPMLVLAHEGTVSPAAKGEALKLQLTSGEVHRADRAGGEYAVVGFERGDVSVGAEDAISRRNRFGAPYESLTPSELLQLGVEAESKGESPTQWRMAFHRRLGQALSPISFAMLGAPLAMARRPGGRARGFLLTLAGYAGYYVLQRFFEQMGLKGNLPLPLAGQMANAVLASLGVLVFWRAQRP